MIRQTKLAANHSEKCPPLPIDADHWQAIVRALSLSSRQAQLVELLLRGMQLKQIAAAMSIGEPTVRTYLDRVFMRTDTHGRMELAMRVLAISHQIDRSRGVSSEMMTRKK